MFICKYVTSHLMVPGCSFESVGIDPESKNHDCYNCGVNLPTPGNAFRIHTLYIFYCTQEFLEMKWCKKSMTILKCHHVIRPWRLKATELCISVLTMENPLHTITLKGNSCWS
jgi:hypothetical protein